MATHSSTLAWKIPRTEEPGRLQSIGSQRVGNDRATSCHHTNMKQYIMGSGIAHWKRPWCWERLRAEGEGGDRGWDGWMASLTQQTWVWTNWEIVKGREAWRAAVHGVVKESDPAEWLNHMCLSAFSTFSTPPPTAFMLTARPSCYLPTLFMILLFHFHSLNYKIHKGRESAHRIHGCTSGTLPGVRQIVGTQYSLAEWINKLLSPIHLSWRL